MAEKLAEISKADCEKCRALLSGLVTKDLAFLERQLVESHLAVCESCFAVYADLIERWIEKEERHWYIRERPIWGGLAWDFSTESELAEQMIRQATEWEKNRSFGTILLRYEVPEMERAVHLLQQRISAQLKKAGKIVIWHTPSTTDFLLPHLQMGVRPLYIILSDASAFPDLPEFIDRLSETSTIILAGSLPRNRKHEILSLHKVWSLVPHPSFQEELRISLDQTILKIRERLVDEPTLWKAYYFVCLLDALGGIPMPTSLLAKLLHKRELELLSLIDTPKRLVFKVDRPGSPLTVVTQGKAVALRALDKIFKVDASTRLQAYQAITLIAEPSDQSERRVIMKLLHALITKRELQLAKELAESSRAKLSRLQQHADAHELFIWGKLMALIRIPEMQKKIVTRSMRIKAMDNYLRGAFVKMKEELSRYRQLVFPLPAPKRVTLEAARKKPSIDFEDIETRQGVFKAHGIKMNLYSSKGHVYLSLTGSDIKSVKNLQLIDLASGEPLVIEELKDLTISKTMKVYKIGSIQEVGDRQVALDFEFKENKYSWDITFKKGNA